MSRRDPRVTLLQMLDFMAEVDHLLDGMTLEDLLQDTVRLRAFERLLELVGEAAKRLPQEIRQDQQQIPWRQITGMRDVISHAYEDLAYEVLWDVVEIHFPVLRGSLQGMLARLEGN